MTSTRACNICGFSWALHSLYRTACLVDTSPTYRPNKGLIMWLGGRLDKKRKRQKKNKM